jgi:hypothetical protein
MLDDIRIEGEIPVPQVLFVTARDQRRFMEFQHHRYQVTSLELGRATPGPSRLVVTSPSPTTPASTPPARTRRNRRIRDERTGRTGRILQGRRRGHVRHPLDRSRGRGDRIERFIVIVGAARLDGRKLTKDVLTT